MKKTKTVTPYKVTLEEFKKAVVKMHEKLNPPQQQKHTLVLTEYMYEKCIHMINTDCVNVLIAGKI